MKEQQSLRVRRRALICDPSDRGFGNHMGVVGVGRPVRLRHPLDARRFSPFLPFLALQMSGRLATLRGSSGITTFRLQAHVCQNRRDFGTLWDASTRVAPRWRASHGTCHENTVRDTRVTLLSLWLCIS